METKKSDRAPQGADKYVVRFPDGMRDRIAEIAKESGRSMNAEIVQRLGQSFIDPGMRSAAERRKLELVASYSSWCSRLSLDPLSSFSEYANAYDYAINCRDIEELEIISSISSVDVNYLKELYANWIVERPARFPILADANGLAPSIPDDLLGRITIAAKNNHRTISDEIAARLNRTFSLENPASDDIVVTMDQFDKIIEGAIQRALDAAGARIDPVTRELPPRTGPGKPKKTS